MEARASGGGSSRSKVGAGRFRAEPLAAEGPLRVEWRAAGEMAADAPAWRGLAARALEPNVFAEPEFLGASLQHGPVRRLSLLTVWQGPALRGLLPITPPRAPFGLGEARLWRPDLAGSGPPLIDRGDAEAVLEAMLDGLSRLGPSGAALSLPELTADGPLLTALRAVTERSRRCLALSNPSERAVLRPSLGVTDSPIGAPDAARADGGRGRFSVESAREPRAIRDAVEEFLALDARLSQADGLPALIEQPGAALLVRTLTRELARSRRCRVDLLRSGERLAAGAITLRSGGRAWLWRIVGERGRDGPEPVRALAQEVARAEGRRAAAITLSGPPLPASAAGVFRGRERVVDVRIATRPDARKAAPLRRTLRRVWSGLSWRRDRAAA